MREVNRFYIQGLSEFTYFERVQYLFINEYGVDWKNAFTGWNPMYWCLMDSFRLVMAAFWISIRPFVALIEARNLKSVYSGDTWSGVFQSYKKIPERHAMRWSDLRGEP